jgi:hypothetical protein
MCRSFGSVGAVTRKRRKTVVSAWPESPRKPEQSNAPEWVVIDFENRGFRCERCGSSERHSTPSGVSRLDSFALRGQAFALDHANCKESGSM